MSFSFHLCPASLPEYRENQRQYRFKKRKRERSQPAEAVYPRIQMSGHGKYLGKTSIFSEHVEIFSHVVILTSQYSQLSPQYLHCIQCSKSCTEEMYYMGRLCRSQANITPFYVRDVSICKFWYPRWSWHQNPRSTKGQQ